VFKKAPSTLASFNAVTFWTTIMERKYVMEKSEAPSRIMYVWALGIIVLGTVLFAVLLFSSLVGEDTRVMVPGSTEITFEESGTYTVYHEYRTMIDGQLYATDPSVSGLFVALTEETSGREIDITSPSFTGSYTINGREGVSVFTFTIDEPGQYELHGWYEGNEQGPDVVLAIKSSMMQDVIIAIGIFLVCNIVGIFLFVRTFLKRRKMQESAT
jgi:hypothetical protein